MQSRDYTRPRLLLPYFIPAHVVDWTGPRLVVIQRLGTKTSLQTDGVQRLVWTASHILLENFETGPGLPFSLRWIKTGSVSGWNWKIILEWLSLSLIIVQILHRAPLIQSDCVLILCQLVDWQGCRRFIVISDRTCCGGSVCNTWSGSIVLTGALLCVCSACFWLCVYGFKQPVHWPVDWPYHAVSYWYFQFKTLKKWTNVTNEWQNVKK